MRRPGFVSWLAFVSCVACMSCSGQGLRGNVYRGDGIAFRVGEMPPTWSRLEVANARLAFRDDAAQSTVLVNGRCGKDGDDVPLQALTQHCS